MKIVVDLQGAQASGRFRGVGRYTCALASAMLQHGRQHEFWIVLNGSMIESAAELTETFSCLLPRQRIRSFHTPAPVAEIDVANAWRTRAAEILREHFLADLAPDLVHLSSLFEGIGHDAVTSIGLASTGIPTAMTVYDLIPLLHPKSYLADERMRAWYLRKVESLKRADMLLAISASAASEAIEALNIPREQVATIGTGVDPVFHPVTIGMAEEAQLRARYGLNRGIVLYTGGADPRKNLQGLIDGFSRLPTELRQTYGITIAGELLDEEKSQLRKAAASAGLKPDNLAFLGYVTDADLVALYSICAVFVFPSLHEGFGLPAAEAMACGAPVIGSNTTSIPEVIGLAEGLFDPRDPDDLSNRLKRVLTDEAFRLRLKAHGPVQASRFTWDAVAMRALDAIERLHHARVAEHRVVMVPSPGSVPNEIRPRLAFISPLPGAGTHIADVAAQLLPKLACHYDITCIIDQAEVTDAWTIANLPLRDPTWFRANTDVFDRFLYCYSESAKHLYVLQLLRVCPGTVLLLNLPYPGLPTTLGSTAGADISALQALCKIHGLEAVDVAKREGLSTALARFPDVEEVLTIADGVIVERPEAIDTVSHLYGPAAAVRVRAVTAGGVSPRISREEARAQLTLRPDDFVVRSFGDLTKDGGLDRLVASWLASELSRDDRCSLICVGSVTGYAFGQTLAEGTTWWEWARIGFVNTVTVEAYEAHLAAADLIVQVGSGLTGQGAGAVRDGVHHGLPVIATGSNIPANLPPGAVIRVDQDFVIDELSGILERLRIENTPLRRPSYCHDQLTHLAEAAKRCCDAVELFAADEDRMRHRRLIEQLARITCDPGPTAADLKSTAIAIAENTPSFGRKQILLDISVLAVRDVGTGIQRVTRNVSTELIASSPDQYRVEFVRLADVGYVYARGYASRFIGLESELLPDQLVELRRGDIFLGLDLNMNAPSVRPWFEAMRRQGVAVFFVIYDLLPATMPTMFGAEIKGMYRAWLTMVIETADGLLCISRSVADELHRWIEQMQPYRRDPLRIGWFHQGSGLAAKPSVLGAEEARSLAMTTARPCILTVGTIEPRKGYRQVITTLDTLWRRGVDVSLVIVGIEGWMMEDLISRIETHPEKGHRLFWLSGISDRMLVRLYQTATVLLAASIGEGFGLPLVEAAQCQLPIIARDLPVFREVAGEHATYFDTEDPDVLADVVSQWLTRRQGAAAPPATHPSWLSWRQSTDQLLEFIVKDMSYLTVRFDECSEVVHP